MFSLYEVCLLTEIGPSILKWIEATEDLFQNLLNHIGLKSYDILSLIKDLPHDVFLYLFSNGLFSLLTIFVTHWMPLCLITKITLSNKFLNIFSSIYWHFLNRGKLLSHWPPISVFTRQPKDSIKMSDNVLVHCSEVLFSVKITPLTIRRYTHVTKVHSLSRWQVTLLSQWQQGTLNKMTSYNHVKMTRYTIV